MFGLMGELFIRCICGARLQMLSNQSGKTALCPRCRITISAPRPRAFELWNGEELPLEELQNIELHEVRDVVTDLDKTTELPPTNSTVADSASHSKLGTQFAEIAKLLESHPTNPLLDSPVSEWIEPSDICLPFKFLSWSLRGVLETPFTRIASSWTGDERLACLLSHLDRARQTIESRTGCPDESVIEGAATAGHVARQLAHTGTSWRTSCEIIERHNLQPVWLGTVAPSLHQLPSTFWKRHIGEFSSKSLLELSEVWGLGPQKMNLIVDIFRQLGTHLESIPSETHLAISLIPKPIQNVNLWLEEVLGEKRIPDVDEIATRFMRPLAMQLRTDLTAEITSLVIRRIGIGGVPETLEEIANDVGLTRERVRQLTKRATEVVQVRWPHGKYLLDDLYDLLRSAPDTQPQLALIRTILDRCFDVEFAKGGSRSEVLSAWRQAGQKRLTPMKEDEIAEWLAGQFPRIAPEVGVGWICEEAATSNGDNGQAVYFSDEPLDRLLHKLFEDRIAVTMGEALEALDGDERSVAGRIARDPRFVEIDDKRIHASHHCSIERHSDVWHVRLTPQSSGKTPRLDVISIENLVQLVIGGLTQVGIADATVWGVHRFANEVIGRIYAAMLPDSVSPFVLQDLLIGHSNGVIRRMRRRRLRWDCADDSIPVRGKRGWVGYAVRQANIPMTIEELGAELREYYQDYEFYVLQQLTLIDDDDEGEGFSGAEFFSGIPHRVPPIVLPDSWTLDLGGENVSQAIKLIAGKIVDVGRRKGFPKSELETIPWLIELVDYYAFGKMNWSDETRTTKEIVTAANRFSNTESHSTKEADVSEPAQPDASVWAMDNETVDDGASLDSIINRLDGLL